MAPQISGLKGAYQYTTILSCCAQQFEKFEVFFLSVIAGNLSQCRGQGRSYMQGPLYQKKKIIFNFLIFIEKLGFAFFSCDVCESWAKLGEGRDQGRQICFHDSGSDETMKNVLASIYCFIQEKDKIVGWTCDAMVKMNTNP